MSKGQFQLNSPLDWITESWNQGWKLLLRSPIQTSTSTTPTVTTKPGCPQVPHPHILGTLPGMWAYHCPGSLCQGWASLSMRKFPPKSDPNLPWCNWGRFLSWGCWEWGEEEQGSDNSEPSKGMNTGIVTTPIPSWGFPLILWYSCSTQRIWKS